MKFLNFKEIVARIQRDGYDITETKLKEYLSQIIEAIDVDTLLLRDTTGKKPVTQYSPYAIPTEDRDFFVLLLEMFTSEDFQAIRSARSRDASLETRKQIVDGFCKIFKHREISDDIINQQMFKMRRRMCIDLDEAKDIISRASNGRLTEVAEGVITKSFGLQYYDKLELLRYYEKNPTIAENYAWDLLNYYTDTRMEPINEFCETVAAECGRDVIERFQQENILAGTLEQDSDYKKYEAIVQKCLEANTIAHPRQKKYNEALKKMRAISERYQIELFGKVLSDEDDDLPPLDPPSVVLKKAIKELDDTNEQLAEFLASHNSSKEPKN